MFSLVSLLSGIGALPAMHSLLVTSDVRNIGDIDTYIHTVSFLLKVNSNTSELKVYTSCYST